MPVSPNSEVGVVHSLAVDPLSSALRAPRFLSPLHVLAPLGLTLLLGACAEPLRPNVEAHARQVTWAGEGVARRNCAECHALNTAQPSALQDAPPFPVLRALYSRDAMAAIIEQRMIEIHPRMPVLKLDVDELNQFLEFWDGLSPEGSGAQAK